jgi:hypothetical protein
MVMTWMVKHCMLKNSGGLLMRKRMQILCLLVMKYYVGHKEVQVDKAFLESKCLPG